MKKITIDIIKDNLQMLLNKLHERDLDVPDNYTGWFFTNCYGEIIEVEFIKSDKALKKKKVVIDMTEDDLQMLLNVLYKNGSETPANYTGWSFPDSNGEMIDIEFINTAEYEKRYK